MSDQLKSLVSEALTTGTITDLPTGHYIEGRFMPSQSGDLMESIDPGTGKAFVAFASGNNADVDLAVQSAKAAFKGAWGKSSPVERSRVLQRASALILGNIDRLAIAETLDCGKPLQEAQGDVRGAARAFEYYAGACDKLQGDSFPLSSDYIGYSIHEAVGVTAHIIPWNFPLSTTARGVAPALAAGCTVVAKPAEQTPLSALMLADILSQAGLPDGAFNVVTGTGINVGAPLVGHGDVDHITFTGSVSTGMSVMKSAANNATRVLLELGGKSPLVVLKDADIDAALDGVIGAIYENAGQICSAGSRLVIDRSIHSEFLERLSMRTQALSVGHGLKNPQLGPLSSKEHLAKVSNYMEEAKARGVEVYTGGKIIEDPKVGSGWFFEPTIVNDLAASDPLVQEEIFGPVLAVQVIDSFEEAIDISNGTEFGLAAGIYTANLSHAHRFAQQVSAGQIYINEYFAGGIEVPFGGNKKSGFGREKGIEGLKSYCSTKSVVARL